MCLGRLLCCATLAGGLACDRASEAGPLRIGDRVPDYTATRLDGGEFELAALNGKTVLLNVWATWCVPCRTEMPVLQAVQDTYASAGLHVIGVNIDRGDADRNVQAFLDDLNITFPTVRDPEDRATRIFRLIGVPETILVDRDSRIAFRWIGQVSHSDVDRRVRQLLDRR
jgi:thiol-disulfide isomerase/thioredoxin